MTAATLLRAIVDDGFLSDTNAARAQEMLGAVSATVSQVPGGAWREEIVGLQHVDGVGWRPAHRTHADAMYLASDVHQLLATLATLLGAAENKLAALQTYHSGPSAQAIEALCEKLRNGPVRLHQSGNEVGPDKI